MAGVTVEAWPGGARPGGSPHRGSATHASAAALGRRFRGPDPDGYRAEFIRLVELADALARQARKE